MFWALISLLSAAWNRLTGGTIDWDEPLPPPTPREPRRPFPRPPEPPPSAVPAAPASLSDLISAGDREELAKVYGEAESYQQLAAAPIMVRLANLLVAEAPTALIAEAFAGEDWGLKTLATIALARRAEPADLDLLGERFDGAASWTDMISIRPIAKAGGVRLGRILTRARTDDPMLIEFMLGEINESAGPALATAAEHEIEEIVTAIPLARARELVTALGVRERDPGLARLKTVLARRVATSPAADLLAEFGRVLDLDRLPAAHGVEDTARLIAEVLERGGRRSVLVIGPHGSGKTTALLLAARLVARDPDPPVVVEVATGDLLRGTFAIGQWQTRLLAFVDEISRPKPVLWLLPDANNLLDAGRAWDQPDEHFGSLLAPRIARGDIAILAESTPEELERGLRRDPRILDLFEPIRLEAPAADAERAIVESVLADLTAELAQGVGREVRVDTEFVPTILSSGRMFAPGMSAPGRSLSLLREVAARAAAEVDSLPPGAALELDRSAVIETVARRTGIPPVLVDDRAHLDRRELRQALRRRVLGQDEAIEVLVDRIALFKAGLTDPGRPLGVFLFAGPTGVGKTELARALAAALFGSDERLLRFDMSEFQSPQSLERLIGSQGPWADKGAVTLAARVRAAPFAVVLLDEFEKAHPDVFDLFLQVFDAGHLTDARGQGADFHGTLIIMTSNLGSGGAPRAGFAPAPIDAGTRREVERFFRPEFLNRIDRVITFSPLDLGVMQRIAEKELAAHLERHGILRRGLMVEVDPEVLRFLIEQGFSPEYGARPLKRVIEQKVLTPLARAIVDRGEEASGALAFLKLERGEVQVLLFTERDLERPVVEESAVEITDRLLGARERLTADELRARATEMAAEVDQAAAIFERELAGEKAELSVAARAPGLWDRPGTARRTFAALERVDRIETMLRRAQKRAHDLCAYLEARPLDGERSHEAAERYAEIRLEADLAGMALGLRAPHEASDAFIKVTALGTGDGNSAHRLARMFMAWAERWRFTVHVLDEEMDGEEMRSAMLLIEGTCVYGLLNGESGLHAFVERRVGDRPAHTDLVRAIVLPTPEMIDFDVAPGEITCRRRPPEERHGLLVPEPVARVEVAHGPTLTLAAGTSALTPERLERHLIELVTVRAAIAAGRAAEIEPAADRMVRRYILGPSPEVRDIDSGLRSGRLDRVLEGVLDPFLRHRRFRSEAG